MDVETFIMSLMLIQVGVSVRWRHNRHTKTDDKVQEALDKARVLPLRLLNCFRVRVKRVEEAIGGIDEFEQKGEPAAANRKSKLWGETCSWHASGHTCLC